jgi:VWFA-related protein
MNVRLLLATTVTLCVPVLGQVQTPPTFQTAINYVEFSVRVVDARGNFVRDLQQSDFQVLEDRQRQTIARFELVDLPVPSPKSTTTNPPSPTNPTSEPLSTDVLQQLDGRLYIFLLDDYHLPSEHSSRTRSVVGSFIRERMGINDAAMVVFASGARGQVFTQDQGLLLSALDRLRGVFDYREPGQVREIKARAVVHTMKDVASAVEPVRGRRKVLIYVGMSVGCAVSRETSGAGDQGFVQGRENLSAAGTGAAPDATQRILCKDEISDAIRQLTRAGTVVYSLDPRGGSHNPAWVSPTIDGRGGPGPAQRRAALVEPGRPSIFDGFHVIAEQTGGFAVTGTSVFEPVLDRIVRENSSYYLIGYYSTNEAATGEFRNNEIQLSQERLKAFYRPGYFAPR